MGFLAVRGIHVPKNTEFGSAQQEVGHVSARYAFAELNKVPVHIFGQIPTAQIWTHFNCANLDKSQLLQFGQIHISQIWTNPIEL